MDDGGSGERRECAYLRYAYESTMKRFAREDVSHTSLNLETVKDALRASKVFYYDAVDDEAEDVDARRAYLEHIQSLDGFHVREGTVRKSKKRGKDKENEENSDHETERKQQKRVDVQLAVECLMHAYTKNMWHASLIAGDLDFEPLVTALINLGTHVHV